MKINPTPTRWELLNDRFFGVDIFIDKREQEDGSYKYSVMSGNSTFLNSAILRFTIGIKDDDSYHKETRFDSFKKALTVYKKYIATIIKEKKKASSSYEMAIQYKYLNTVIGHEKIEEQRKKIGAR